MPPRRACDVCFKRKIQCSIQHPGRPCNWCNHRGIACTFTREPQKKGQGLVSPEAVHELYRRINQLEGDLARRTAPPRIPNEACPSSTGLASGTVEQGAHPEAEPPPSVTVNSFATSALSSPAALPRAGSTNFGLVREPLYSHGPHLGQNWCFKGMPILSERGREWISSRTGQAANLDKLRLLDFPADPVLSFTLSAQSYIFHQELGKLPEEPAVQKAIDIVCRSHLRFSFPILDRDHLRETVAKADKHLADTESSQSQVPARACAWALLAITGQLQPGWNSSVLDDSKECARRAQALLGHVAEVSSVEALQAALLLHMYRAFTGQWRSSSFLLSLACRMVCDLGGHFFQSKDSRSAEDPFSDRRRRYIRDLFWLCYVLDKDVSLRLRKLPLLTEDYCDLTLPKRAGTMYTSAVEDFTHHLPHDPRLSMIKEKTARLLYTPKAFRITDSQLLLNIRQLDDELEQWRLSIPPLTRPRLSIPSNRPLLPPDASLSQSIQYINLQLDYHYTLTTIHTTVRRCGTTNEDENLPENLHSVVHSSIDLSLEAGRSTLCFLRAPMGLLEEGAFRYILFYAPIAAMTLFINILIHPLDARAQHDVEVLVAAIGIIQSIPLRALSSYETEYIQELGDFIMELVRLGSGAIWQAKKGGAPM